MPVTTVLLDLDDTLLNTNTRTFISAYLNALGQALTDFGSPEKMVQIVLDASKKMQRNANPQITNQDAFYEVFWSHLNGVSREKVQTTIERFYRQTYPTLKKYTESIPAAPMLMRYLHAQGHKVIVATNPLFPQTAVEQRMDWAGVQGFPHALVTTMENSHFSKPNPDYYREILTAIGSSPKEAIMVGDDLINDIAPARSLGIKTWWITAESHPPVGVSTEYHGSLKEFYEWVTNGGLGRLK